MVLPAVVVGVVGLLICAATLALTPDDVADEPWRFAGTVAVGSVLVQIGAGLVGTGLGLLLRSVVVWRSWPRSVRAVWRLFALLGAVDALRPALPWLTPLGSARNLLSGEMSVLRWAQWLCVLLIWGVGLNAVGAAVLNRRDLPGRSLTPRAHRRGSCRSGEPGARVHSRRRRPSCLRAHVFRRTNLLRAIDARRARVI